MNPAKQKQPLGEWIRRHGRTSGPSYEAIAREAAARAFEEAAEHVDTRFRVIAAYYRRRAAELRTTQVPTYNDD